MAGVNTLEKIKKANEHQSFNLLPVNKTQDEIERYITKQFPI